MREFICGAVCLPVDLNNNLGRQQCKVGNIGTDRVLTPEVVAAIA